MRFVLHERDLTVITVRERNTAAGDRLPPCVCLQLRLGFILILSIILLPWTNLLVYAYQRKFNTDARRSRASVLDWLLNLDVILIVRERRARACLGLSSDFPLGVERSQSRRSGTEPTHHSVDRSRRRWPVVPTGQTSGRQSRLSAGTTRSIVRFPCRRGRTPAIGSSGRAFTSCRRRRFFISPTSPTGYVVTVVRTRIDCDV